MVHQVSRPGRRGPGVKSKRARTLLAGNFEFFNTNAVATQGYTSVICKALLFARVSYSIFASFCAAQRSIIPGELRIWAAQVDYTTRS